MQMMLMIEDEAEAEVVAEIFARRNEETCSPIYGRVEYIADKEVKDLFGNNPIVYYYHDDVYTVYNFHTGEKFENVEGDVAGLMNLPRGNFPF